MELDKNLVNLQGTLYSFSKQGILNKPDTIQQVVNGIKEVSENVPDDAKSKLTFLMVLCTRLSISEKLKHDNFVGQYLHSELYFEMEYLIIYVYHLHLHSELFRIIENCPGPLGLELLDEVITYLKKPDICQVEIGSEHLYQLWQSVFVKLCKIVTGHHKEDTTDKFVTSYLSVYDLIEEVLITFMKNDTEFDGLHLYYFFKTLLFCIKLQKNPVVSDDPIYELSIEFNFSKECICHNAMTNCIEKVFEKIPNILQSLTIDMWVYFSECYCSVDSKNSVQLLIGNLVYNILKEVRDREKLYNVHSDVLGFFSTIAINKSEVIKKAGILEIISNVKNGNTEFFKALVRHSAFTTNESLECLINHLELADLDDLNVILNTSYECLCIDDGMDDLDLIKKLFLAALRKIPNCVQWLEKIFENYQPNLLKTAETHVEHIETFNKISKDKNTPHSDLIVLCVQSPLETIKKICHIAVFGPEETQFVIETLKLLKCPCNVIHIESFTLLDYVLLKSLLDVLTDKEKQSFISVIVQLGKEKILTVSFYNNLLKCLKENLENEILERAILCLEILKAVLDLKIFEFHTAAFLSFMCHVLEYFSWDFTNFSIVKSEGREQIDGIVSLIINGLEGNENVSDFQWARKEILKSCELNHVYFCDLWFKFNSTWSNQGTFNSLILALAHSHHKSEDLRNVVVNFDEAFEIRASIILSLTMLLPVFTFQKWNSIFRQLILVWRNINPESLDLYHDVLDMFGTSLLMLSLNLNNQENTFPCYKYCLRNYVKLTKQCCPKMRDESLLMTFEKIFVFLGEIEDEEKRKSCWEIFSPLLMELIDRLRKKEAVETHRNKIEELLPLLDLKDVTEGLLKKLP